MGVGCVRLLRRRRREGKEVGGGCRGVPQQQVLVCARAPGTEDEDGLSQVLGFVIVTLWELKGWGLVVWLGAAVVPCVPCCPSCSHLPCPCESL